MSDFQFVVDIQGAAHFEQQVIELSKQQPVLVDFWADWCSPCKVLIPLLSQLSEQYNGAFILAKVNADEQQDLLAAAGVRNLPTVKLYKDGVVVDEFVGAKPEAEIRQFLDAHIENETDKQIQLALELSDNGQHSEAIERLKNLNQQEPTNSNIYIAIAKVYLQCADYDNCDAVLKALPANVQVKDEVKQLQDKLALAQATSDAPDIDEITSQLAASPDDHNLRLQLARQYIVSNQHEQALEALFHVIKDDISFNDGEAKGTMLKVFEILGPQSPLTRSYRSKLACFLH